MVIKLFLIMALGSLSLVSSKKIIFDPWEGLLSNPAWNVSCDHRNYINISNHECNYEINLPITPENSLLIEHTFWSGCYGACLLTYTLGPMDREFSFRIYFSNRNATVTVVKNGNTRQEIFGNKWTTVTVNLNATLTIGIYIPEATNGNFILLEKIFPEVEDVWEKSVHVSVPNLFASTGRLSLSPKYNTTPKPTSVFSLSYFKYLLSRVPLLSTPFAR